MTSHVIKDKADLSGLSYTLERKCREGKTFTVTVTDGAPRTLSQSALLHMWFGQIAEAMGDRSLAEVKAECHLAWGIPILRAEDPEFNAFFDAAFAALSYDEKIKALVRGFVPVSSIMTAPQLSRYMREIWDCWSPEARLTDPEGLRWRSAA